MNAQRIIWLASFPKSGNTWLRVLLANYFMGGKLALTINELHRFTTADIRQDFFDKAAGRPFAASTPDEWLAMRPRALQAIALSKPDHHFVKTHSKIALMGNQPLIPPAVTAGAIYVLRNPFDVAPSYARHLSIDIDTAITTMLDDQAFNGTSTGILEVIGRWDDHVRSWMTADGLLRHMIRYEDMRADTEAEVRKLFAFMKIPVKDGQMRRAIRAASFENLQKQEKRAGFKERPQGMASFFTSGKAGGWRDALTAAQVARLREAFLPTLEAYYPELLDETAAFAAGAS